MGKVKQYYVNERAKVVCCTQLKMDTAKCIRRNHLTLMATNSALDKLFAANYRKVSVGTFKSLL